MHRLLSLTLCFVSAIASPLKNDDGESRILNGNVAAKGQFPFAVSLQQYYGNIEGYSHVCTLSLITTKSCLGAAHCVYEDNKLVPVKDLCVIVGSNVQSNKLPCEAVDSAHPHENYDLQIFINDILVVNLANAVIFGPNVQTLRLAGPNVEILGESATALGWGYYSADNVLPRRLRYTFLNVIEQSNCNAVGWKSLASSQVCLNGDGHHSTCGGDSGGPVIFSSTNIEFALVSYSYSKGCGAKYPAVFTDVRKFIDWIREHSEGEPDVVESM